MFISYNFIQIKCLDCHTVTNYHPGKTYDVIECPVCKEKKETTDEKKSTRKRNTKDTEEV